MPINTTAPRAIPEDSTPKDYKLIIYNKAEIDTKFTDEADRVNTALDSKVDKQSVGSPVGLATLDENGKQSFVEVSYATSQEASDGLAHNRTMTPALVKQEIDSAFQDADAVYIPLTDKAAPQGVATLDYSTLIPTAQIPDLPYVDDNLVAQPLGIATLDANGKLTSEQVPITGSVASYYVEAILDMLALTDVKEGDRCIVHNNVNDPSKNGEYVALIDAPTLESDWGKVPVVNAVTSVNGQAGVVNITTIDESAQNKTDIATLRSDIDTNTYNISQNTTNITTNTSDIATNTINIQINADDITTLDSKVSSNESNITDLATNILNIESGVAQLDYIGMVPRSSVPNYRNGNMWFQGGTLNIQTLYTDVIQQVGKELWVDCINLSGDNLLNGTVVRLAGISNGVAVIEPAIATTFNNARIFGMLTHNVVDGAQGVVTAFGNVNGLNLSGFATGDTVYLSETTPGAITNVAPNIASKVGVIVNADATSGTLFACIENNMVLPQAISTIKGNTSSISLPANSPQLIQGYGSELSVYASNDPSSGTVGVEFSGIYNLQFSFSGVFSDEEVNCIVDIYDVTNSTVMEEFEFSVGRGSNATAVPINQTFIMDLYLTAGTVYIMRYTSATAETLTLSNAYFSIKSVKIDL